MRPVAAGRMFLKLGLLVSAALVPWLTMCWIVGLLRLELWPTTFLIMIRDILCISVFVGPVLVLAERWIVSGRPPFLRKAALVAILGLTVALALTLGFASGVDGAIGVVLAAGLYSVLLILTLAIYVGFLRWCRLPISGGDQSTTLVGPAD